MTPDDYLEQFGRLLIWEGLERPRGPYVLAEERRTRVRRLVEHLAAGSPGEFAVDPNLVYLALIAIRAFAQSHPQQAEWITGDDPHSTAYEARISELISVLLERLGGWPPGNDGPPPDHHSFDEHDRIVAAIASRDLDGAARAMRLHLRAVERSLVEPRAAAE